MKSGGDFEDILAADTPAIWTSNRPAKGGATGAMLEDIIEKAAELKTEKAKHAKSKGKRRQREGKSVKSTAERDRQRREAPRALQHLLAALYLCSNSRRPQRQPDRVCQPPPIVTRNVATPEISFDQLASFRQRSELERPLVLGRITLEHLSGWSGRVVNEHVDRPSDGVADLACTASPAVKPFMPLPSVSRFAIRITTGPCILRSASRTPSTRKIGIRLV